MSKVGIMQPYFFPYLGYYSLIAHTDQFILFDGVQFMRHGWIERNRILKPNEGWQYVAAPLEKFPFGTKIRHVKVRQAEDWKGKLLRQLEHYKKRSPYYKETIEIVEDCLSVEARSITLVNKKILETTCRYIGFNPILQIFSEMDLMLDPVSHSGEWALNISKAIGATEYINPIGGAEVFDKSQFNNAKIKLSFLGNNLKKYSQRRPTHESGLSIIDVMMFNSKEQINTMLNDIYYLEN